MGRATTVQLQATHGLLRRILSDRLKVGTVLPAERDLEVDLKVSRMTLRGAVATLVAHGLLTVRHGSGTTVRSWLADGSFEMLGHLLQSRDGTQGTALMQQLLWLRRTLYVALMELCCKAGFESRPLASAELLLEDALRHERTDVAQILGAEEQLLCAFAEASGNVPATMLANGIRRALGALATSSQRVPRNLKKEAMRFRALTTACNERREREARQQVEELCRLREGVYLALAKA